MNMKRILQIGNILALAFALVANFLVGTQALDLPAINAISDKYATPLTPATYAFSIWSLIYVLLIIFAIYQARDLFKPRSDNDLPTLIGPLFIIASIVNGLWTYIFVKELIGLSVIVLVLLTGSLYAILWRLKIALNKQPLKTLMCVWWPLMIYTGWVTAATVVNIASWFESMNVTITPAISNIILIVLGFALATLLYKRNTRALILASSWGIAAVGVQQLGAAGNRMTAITALSVAGLLIVGAALQLILGTKLENKSS